MSAVSDRIAEVLRDADFYAKRPDHYYQLLAAAVEAELQLTEVLALRDRHSEERWPSGTGSNCRECNGRRFPCPTRQVLDRWVTAAGPVPEEQP